MIIALYKTYTHLPFFKKSGERAAEAFDPEVHGQRRIVLADETPRMRESSIWPALMGLHAIKSHHTAHVSAFCECHGKNQLHFSRQVRIQIGEVVISIDPESKTYDCDSWKKFFTKELRIEAR